MYGEFKWADKYKTWDRIQSIHQHTNLPCLIMGDMNEILYNHEKEGGRSWLERFIKAFHDALDECNLEDAGFVGDPFTWHRRALRERLDRGLANQSWINLHDTAAIIHLEYNHSDHRPIMLDTEYYVPSPGSINQSTRSFEAKWLKEQGFNDVVVQQWEAAQTAAIDVHGRLRAMHGGLHA
jgi:hypothetical protein